MFVTYIIIIQYTSYLVCNNQDLRCSQLGAIFRLIYITDIEIKIFTREIVIRSLTTLLSSRYRTESSKIVQELSSQVIGVDPTEHRLIVRDKKLVRSI